MLSVKSNLSVSYLKNGTFETESIPIERKKRELSTEKVYTQTFDPDSTFSTTPLTLNQEISKPADAYCYTISKFEVGFVITGISRQNVTISASIDGVNYEKIHQLASSATDLTGFGVSSNFYFITTDPLCTTPDTAN